MNNDSIYTEIESYTSECGAVLKVGSIIKAYTPGYHVVTKILDRSWKGKGKAPAYSSYSDSPLIEYKQIITGNFENTEKKQIRSCDSAWCYLATTIINDDIRKLQRQLDTLTELKNKLNHDSCLTNKENDSLA